MKKTVNNTLRAALPLALGCLALASSCNNPNQRQNEDGSAESDTTQNTQPALTEAWKTDSVFTGSESTLYDPEAGVIYVSCGNTDAGAKDGDGFIAVLNPDGSVKEMSWVSGLHAPKGMALLNGKLYVTDIDEVKIIDVAGAAVEKSIPVEGAQFLNDLATDGTTAYFSDSRSGKIYSLSQEGTVETVVENAEGINGLECYEGNLYTLDKEGLKMYDVSGYTPTLIDSTVKGGDGLVILNDSTFVASRWAGEIYFIRGSESTVLLDTKAAKSNTADIGYIPDEQLVIVPTFMKNEVAAYKLEM
ncbi:hypothetical protein EDD80_112108 [Anseongella ginsenosidimutans]|uniref:ATP/GTP-binding protein n=1 Tax=Anseongella ginsenosidimutans TaxID=496056 RepID=A0A4R3KMJ7_9SPHI|nr:hypothetical protein [Anseongella ginsenosidimutans]TCS85533.1 hypothetical protein EDD80_112108 [Anseongella ginsenosidimutans]